MPSSAKPAMLFFTFVWKNIFRRRARSALTVVGLAVAVAAVVALVGISDGFSRHFKELYDRRGVDLVVQRGQSAAELNNGLPEEMEDKIAQVPGVDAVMGGLMDVVSFPDHDLTNVIINGWRADSPLFDELHILPGGRRLVKGDRRKVLLGSVLADDLGVKVGDQIQIHEEDVEIVGIYKSPQVYERSSIATLLPDMQHFMSRPHQVTAFIVRTKIPKDGTPEHRAAIAAIGKQIETLGDKIDAQPADEFINNVGPIKLSRGMAWATSAIALLIGAIGMLNTMVMSVYERIREIGTLRAIGWRKIQVVRMILVEALLLSLAGGLVGSVGAMGLTNLLSHMKFARYVGADVVPWVVPWVFAEGLALAVVVGLLGAVYPAIWGANLRPIEAMRRK